MTRERAIEILKDENEKQGHFKGFSMYSEALEMAISALSAEPCREADDYENEIADLHNRLDIAEYDKERYKEEITTLEAKNKGEWIESKERSKHWYCSVCGGIHTDPETGKWREIFDYKYPFCPNCGADMRGE